MKNEPVAFRPWIVSARAAGHAIAREQAAKRAQEEADSACMRACRERPVNTALLAVLSDQCESARKAVSAAYLVRVGLHNRACREYAADNRTIRRLRFVH